MSGWVSPPLTTIAQPLAQMAAMAEAFPHLTAMVASELHDNAEDPLGWCDSQSEFEFTLGLILGLVMGSFKLGFGLVLALVLGAATASIDLTPLIEAVAPLVVAAVGAFASCAAFTSRTMPA